MTPDTAEVLALKALEFLINSPDPLESFLSASGINPGDLKDRLGEPAVLAEVLDFMLKNEPLLIEFCENAPGRARDLHHAHHVLTNL